MSWQDRLENIKFTITTGDEKVFTPLWKNGEKSFDFNISKYDFIDVEGSFVDRKKPQGGRFPLVFWFQGDDNIDQANDFEESSKDSRIWTVEHPFYGTIKGQPVNLKRVDTSYNVTEVSVDFWESIVDDLPLSEVSTEDSIKAKVDAVNEQATEVIVENAVPDTKDIPKILQFIQKAAGKFKAGKDTFNDYKNKVEAAEKAANNLLFITQEGFNAIQEVVNFPANFAESLEAKLGMYIGAFDDLLDGTANLFSKYQTQSQGASIIAGVANSVIQFNETDLTTRDEIESVNEQLLTLYQNYLEALDENQVEAYDVDNAWVPDATLQSSLLSLVTEVSTSLFALSFEARQERTFLLTDDDNLITLTHRFMGLDADDNNIESFRKVNNIKNINCFKIRKGTEIKYFV